MRPPHTTALYEDGLVALWERLVTTFGVPTVRVLLDRAIWQTAQCYPDLALIQHDDAGLSFEALEKRYAPRPPEEIEAAFNALFAGLLLILGRLLGGEMAQRLTAEPAVTAAGVARARAAPSTRATACVPTPPAAGPPQRSQARTGDPLGSGSATASG